jgi:hypothetical protein
MAFDVSGLTAHIEENSLDFSMKAITGSKIWTLGADVRQGLKDGVTLKVPLLEQTAPFQAGTSCAVNASGTTTPTQVSLETSSIVVSPEWCLKDLEAYFLQMGLGKGSVGGEETFSGMTKIMDRLAATIARNVGMQVVQGKTTYTNATYLKQIDGLIAKIDTAGTAINGNTSSETSITTSNVITIFNNIIAAIPNRVFALNPVVICGMDTYRTLVAAQRAANAFNYFPTANDYTALEQIFPGTNVKIIAIPELNNDNPVETGVLPTAVKNRIFALNMDNVLIGTDKLGEWDEFDIWFDKNTRKLKSYARFTLGVNAKFFDEIVQYTNV